MVLGEFVALYVPAQPALLNPPYPPPEVVAGIKNVKCKYKRLPGNKLRWLLLVYGEEQSLLDLESAWEMVALQINALEIRILFCTCKFLQQCNIVTSDLNYDFPPSNGGHLLSQTTSKQL